MFTLMEWGFASCQKRVGLEQGCGFVTFSGKPRGADSTPPEQLWLSKYLNEIRE